MLLPLQVTLVCSTSQPPPRCDWFKNEWNEMLADNLFPPTTTTLVAVWPDWAIYYNLANFSKPVATMILPKLPTLYSIFVKVLKSFIFLVKSFLGNFYRHLAIFYWSHWFEPHVKQIWDLSVPVFFLLLRYFINISWPPGTNVYLLSI